MSETTRQFKKQLPKNAVSAALSFVTYSLSAIWLTPYLVRNLGAAAYGLISLAGLFTQFGSIITRQVSGSVTRFLSIELQKPDGNPNVVFNSSLALFLILILIQAPLYGIGLLYANHLFTIPSDLVIDALLFLGCSVGGFLVTLLGSVFGVSLYAKNRLDIGAGINTGRLLLRLLLIVLCFILLGPKLRYIGFVDLFLSIASTLISIYIWRSFTPELRVSVDAVNPKILLPIFGMSFWTLFNSFGGILYMRTDIFIINRFISPVVAGQYAAVIVAANFVRQLAMMFSTQFGPVSMSYWAKGEANEMTKLLRVAIKLLSLVLAIAVAFLCLNGRSILRLWLGPEYSQYAWLLVVLCVHLPINAAVHPLLTLHTASNTVQLPAVVTFVMGVLNVVLSYLLGVTFEYGAVGVAIATAVALTLKNAIFTPWYAAFVLKKPFGTFIKPLYSGVVMMTIIWALSSLDIVFLSGKGGGVISMMLKGFAVFLIGGILGWQVLLSKDDRRILFNMLPEKVRPCVKRFSIGM